MEEARESTVPVAYQLSAGKRQNIACGRAKIRLSFRLREPPRLGGLEAKLGARRAKPCVHFLLAGVRMLCSVQDFFG